MAASSKRRKLAAMSVDEFLTTAFNSGSQSYSDPEKSGVGSGNESSVRRAKFGKDKKMSQPQAQEERKEKPKGEVKEHKEQLLRLEEKDPEFFKFLVEHDQKLLNFDDSSDEENQLHVLPEKLEVASDEEEQKEPVPKDKKARDVPVTIRMVETWKEAAKDKLTFKLFHDIVMAFKAAVSTTKGDDDGGQSWRYKVEDRSVFNALVSFCIQDRLFTSLYKLLQLKPDEKKLLVPSSSPQWSKVRQDLSVYLSSLVELLSSLTEVSVVSAVLHHMLNLVPYYLCFPKHSRVLLKQVITQWSTGDETVRVLAFLILNKISRLKKDIYLNLVLKQMYVAYVKNCKFTSPTVLPMINFMQRSLTEMYALDHHITYQHAFIYIRQLAIHLRSAMTIKKKETYQSVYNWQFVHCLFLWCRLLGTLYPNEVLEPLIYPLTQVIIGCIKLLPTARYYPLRLHCVRALTMLSDSTKTFIPVIPFLLEVFQQVDFNKKPGRLSMRPINFAVILKLSNVNLQEKAFRDGLIEQMYDQILEYLNTQAHTIGFPELVLPSLIQMKTFLKECKVANYCKQIRQLLEKVQENSSFITKRRQKVTFGVADKEAVALWEKEIKEEGPPLQKYYSSWKKLREKEIALEISGKERLEDLNFPQINRRKLRESKEKDKKEFRNLFDSDSSSDDESYGFKIKDASVSNSEDIVQDLSDMSSDDAEEDEDDELSFEDESDDDNEETRHPSCAVETMSHAELEGLAEGDEDVVEDLEISDED